MSLFMARYDDIWDMLGRLWSPGSHSPYRRLDFTSTGPRLDNRDIMVNTLISPTGGLVSRSGDGYIVRAVNLEALVSSLCLAFEATDPRDTVFAVLSLASDVTRSDYPIYTPDKSSLPKIVLFIHFLRTICCSIFKFMLGWHLLVFGSSSQSSTNYAIAFDDRISPDYKKSLTDVYTGFIDYCVETSMSLDILCRYWAAGPPGLTPRQKLQLQLAGRDTEPEALPRWILRIENHAFWGSSGIKHGEGRKNGVSFVGDSPDQQNYNASKSLPPDIRFGRCRSLDRRIRWWPPRKDTPAGSYPPGVVDPRSRLGKYDGTLHVKGFTLGIIKKISFYVCDGVIPAEALLYGGWPGAHQGDRLPNMVPERLWRTLVADRDPKGGTAPSWYRRACGEVLMHVNPNGDLNTTALLNLRDLPTLMRAYLNRMHQVTWGRRFFLAESKTGESLYGLAPHLASEGDFICIFFGCSVPVIVRRISPKEYRFVGESYVYGAMKGEALQGEINSEYFVLI